MNPEVKITRNFRAVDSAEKMAVTQAFDLPIAGKVGEFLVGKIEEPSQKSKNFVLLLEKTR